MELLTFHGKELAFEKPSHERKKRFATKKDKFHYTKGTDALKVFPSSEHGQRTFCSHCGTQLTFESVIDFLVLVLCSSMLSQKHREDLMDITVASSDCAEKLVPSFDIHVSSHISWVPTDPKLPKYDHENQKGVWFTA